MKKTVSILLSLLLLISLLPIGLTEDAVTVSTAASDHPVLNLPHDPNGTPSVFYQGNTVVEPGNAVSIRGEYLDQAWTATLSDGEQSAQVELLQQNQQSFKFIVPTDFAEGAYTLTLAGEKPLP